MSESFLQYAWRVLRLPSIGGTPYERAVIAIGHVIVGAILASPFDVLGTIGAALFWMVLYWAVKELGDVSRGGDIKDGIRDALAVGLGALYPGPWWWALLAGGVGVAAFYMGWRAQRV